MHELSVAMSIIEGVEEEAERHQGYVTAIHLKLGLLSGIVKEALLSAFEMAREQSATLQKAQLIIEDVPVIANCPSCRQQQPVSSIQWFCCSVCSTPVSDVVQGKELEVVALEIQDGS
jgi:hydrogenase nickel incorporation protein HypA/HybF